MKRLMIVLAVVAVWILLPTQWASAQTSTETPTKTLTPTPTNTATHMPTYTVSPSPAAGTPTPGVNLKAEMISCWGLNEVSGTRYDSVGPNHLTDNNTVNYAGSGMSGGAASFVFANAESLTVADNQSLRTGSSMTVAAWFYPGSVVTLDSVYYHPIINKVNEFMLFDKSISIGFKVGAGGSNYQYGRPIYANTWHLAVGTIDYERSVTGIYVDELPVQEIALTIPTPQGNSVNISYNYANYYWDGIIDTVVMWRRVLSASEVGWFYNNGYGRSCADLISSGNQVIIPTSTPTPETLTKINTSNGNTAYFLRQIDYGDIAVSIGLGMLTLIILGSTILEVVHRWLP